MSAKGGVLNVQLVGGPFDGLHLEDWSGTKVFAFNVDELVPPAGEVVAIYRRATPDRLTVQGFTKFLFEAVNNSGLIEL